MLSLESSLGQQQPLVGPTEIKMIISERHPIDVAADKCTYVPVLGCLTTIPRMLFSCVIGCGTLLCSPREFNHEEKYNYIIKRAHMECCRGVWESIPCGILCMNKHVHKYKQLGLCSPYSYGKYVYWDPVTDNVCYSSKKNLKVFGWAKYISPNDDDDEEIKPESCAEVFGVRNYAITRLLTEEETKELAATRNIFPIKMSTLNNFVDTKNS